MAAPSFVIANDTLVASSDGRISHWVDQPSFRGTWDIIWTSLATIFMPERPIQRIPNDRFAMDPYKSQEYCLCFATLLFTGIHVAGWNFSFPTTMERVLWRVASLMLFGVTAVFWIFETMASWKRLQRWTWLYLRVWHPERLPDFEKARTEKLSQPTEESTQLPLPWEFWSILPIALLYGAARMYLIVEAFLELRSVDATAFENVDWSLYIPHI